VLDFLQRLWLAKRKTNRHVASNVVYCPTLPPSDVRRLQPPHFHNLNRACTKPIGTTNIILSASNSWDQAHSKAAYWTAISIIITKYLNTFCLPVKTLISWKHTKVAVQRTQLTSPVYGDRLQQFLCVSELSSSVPCQITATVSPREGYPELPDLSDTPLPYSIHMT
jgi:hypothetical protein